MTAFILNVTFDCRDPATLSAFWAAATGYDVDPESTPERVRLVRPDRRGVKHLLFRRVAHPTPGKARLHVDLAARRPEEEVERLVMLGATLVDATIDGGCSNEFCLG